MSRSGPAFDYQNGPAGQTSRRPVLVPSGPTPAPSMGPTGSFQSQSSQQFQSMGQGQFEPLMQRPFLPMQPQQAHQPLDVIDLYSKLVNSGIIASAGSQEQQSRQATPPRLGKNRLGSDDVVERKSAEPDLRDFAPGLMKV